RISCPEFCISSLESFVVYTWIIEEAPECQIDVPPGPCHTDAVIPVARLRTKPAAARMGWRLVGHGV
ncbi:MAG: hypothetical protein WCH40_05295, partial [Verrucomicrobiales bacterium]